MYFYSDDAGKNTFLITIQMKWNVEQILLKLFQMYEIEKMCFSTVFYRNFIDSYLKYIKSKIDSKNRLSVNNEVNNIA